MKTENHSIQDVLKMNSSSFFIPPYQRAYAWGRQEISRYFDDIRRIIRSELDPNERDKLEHFFGTLVVKNESDGLATRTILIDGQQRITTTLILLIVLRDIIDDPEQKQQLTNSYLINPYSTNEDKIKLKQVSRDWEAYRALINNQQHLPGNITAAYDLFRGLVTSAMEHDSQMTPVHFINALAKLNVAVIILDERPFKGEDPQIIFETLNSLGKPLTLSDLIRNYILLSMRSERQTEVYESLWYPKIEKVLGSKTSYYFRDYLQLKEAQPAKSVSSNNTKELYQKFKDYVSNNNETHDQLIQDIVSYVEYYKYLLDPEYQGTLFAHTGRESEIRELVRCIFQDIRSEAFKPLVLGLLHDCDISGSAHSVDRLIDALTTIQTYLIRRRVVRATQGENKAIPRLCESLDKLTGGQVRMIDLLTSLTYNLRMPNDDEIAKALRTSNFYHGLRSYAKFILGKIEEHLTKVSVDFRDSRITIEHIMPQTLSDHWRDFLGDQAEEIHREYLDNIGNLILTEFNTEIGNKPFELKREKLATSSLHYRLDVIDKSRWDEAAITDHRDLMIRRFLETFPLPKPLRESNNWKSGVRIPRQFSPLDLESDLKKQISGTKPLSITVERKEADAKTWQEVILRFVQLITATHITMDYLIESQMRLFKRKDVFVRADELKSGKSGSKPDRYKTPDGKPGTSLSDLPDDQVLVLTNISAYTCISRIEAMMKDLNLAKDDVIIKIG